MTMNKIEEPTEEQLKYATDILRNADLSVVCNLIDKLYQDRNASKLREYNEYLSLLNSNPVVKVQYKLPFEQNNTVSFSWEIKEFIGELIADAPSIPGCIIFLVYEGKKRYTMAVSTSAIITITVGTYDADKEEFKPLYIKE